MRLGTLGETDTPFCQVHGAQCDVHEEDDAANVLIFEGDLSVWMCLDAASEIAAFVKNSDEITI